MRSSSTRPPCLEVPLQQSPGGMSPNRCSCRNDTTREGSQCECGGSAGPVASSGRLRRGAPQGCPLLWQTQRHGLELHTHRTTANTKRYAVAVSCSCTHTRRGGPSVSTRSCDVMATHAGVTGVGTGGRWRPGPMRLGQSLARMSVAARTHSLCAWGCAANLADEESHASCGCAPSVGRAASCLSGRAHRNAVRTPVESQRLRVPLPAPSLGLWAQGERRVVARPLRPRTSRNIGRRSRRHAKS